MKQMIYADNAATTKLDNDAFEAMKPYLLEEYGNPSQPYSFSRPVKKALTNSRETIAACINADPDEIFFTSGGTESDNWAIKGIACSNYDHRTTITSAFEHHAVLHTLAKLEKQGFEVTYLSVGRQGNVTAADVAAAIREDTCLVTTMTANNEIGSVLPIAEIGAVCREKKVLFHTDAVQAVGHIPMNVAKMNIDMLSLSAHKFHGPKGVGVLFSRKGVALTNLIEGGAQEKGKRAGTENVAGVVGLAAALKEATDHLEENMQRVSALRDKLIAGLSVIPHSVLNGDKVNRLPGNVHFCFEGIEGESLLLLLDEYGVEASSGSACTSGSLDPSHVLLAIGHPHEIAHGSLRLTLSEYTTEAEVDFALAAIPKVVERLRNMSPVWRDKINGIKPFLI